MHVNVVNFIVFSSTFFSLVENFAILQAGFKTSDLKHVVYADIAADSCSKLRDKVKRECPLILSHIANMWQMMKNQNFSYSS